MKVLVINTYAGSLLLGARTAKCDVIGSYEDVGFGTDIQRANWPDTKIIDKTEDWPSQDLLDVVVIAHPPCSAFSLMNVSPTARGPDSKAFSCTKQVLKYAMSHGARAIAIESVCGAMNGAWRVHDQFAKEYGYRVYRILQNGVMFNSCQWRERFWIVYVKDGPETLHLSLVPRYTTVGDLVAGYEDGPTVEDLDAFLLELKHKLRYRLTEEQVDQLFSAEPPGFGPFVKVAHKAFCPDEDYELFQWDVYGEYGGGQLELLNPNGFSSVLLGGSWYYLNGRNLSVNGYKRFMGFPIDYEFPTLKRNYLGQMRMFLSKGVIPQVAAWVLSNVRRHLRNERRPEGYEVEIESGQVADFRIKKTAWKKMWKECNKMARVPATTPQTYPKIRHYWEK
jgi:site-specific DNA-cytosine methylase